MATRKSSSVTPKRLQGLWYHPTGGYAKKFRGQTYYFGQDPEVAAQRFKEEWPYIQAGEAPPEYSDELTLLKLCNSFMADRESRVQTGDLAVRSFEDYKRSCKAMLDSLGKHTLIKNLRPAEFGILRSALARSRGPVALANEIRRCKVVFNFAYKNFLVEQPVRYGTQFAPPSAKRLRQAENERGPLLFTASDFAKLLGTIRGETLGVQGACNVHLRAMVLLAVNAGFGNSDLARLPLDAVDAESGWIDYARAKNAMPRRCPLWPETQEALIASLKNRPVPKPTAKPLFFVTRFGGDWAGDCDDVISKEFRKTLDATSVHRPRLGFYSLRRTFRTYADECGDDRAAGLIMGHTDTTIAGRYVQQIADKRLVAVTDHVRKRVLRHEGEVDQPN